MFHHLYRFIGEGPANGKIFRVVDASNRDMVAFTEWWKDEDYEGHTWRGSLVLFRKQFTLVKVKTG